MGAIFSSLRLYTNSEFGKWWVSGRWVSAEYKHIEFGTINDEKGKPFKTREGGTNKLSTLYKETFDYIQSINEELEELNPVNFLIVWFFVSATKSDPC